MSITNAAELIAMEICNRFEILPEELVYIEHYDEDSYHGQNRGEAFDLVRLTRIEFTWDARKANDPEWTRLKPEDLVRLAGGFD